MCYTTISCDAAYWHDACFREWQKVEVVTKPLTGGLIMSNRFSLIRSFSLIGLAALMILTGCNSTGPLQPVEKDTPPVLPSASTMKPDYSLFELAAAKESSIVNKTPGPELLAEYPTKLNYINAAVRVLFVELVVFSSLQPPVAAFAVALNSVPQKQPDGSWLWTYIFVDGEIEYGIYLRGKDAGDHNEWSMRVSSSNPEMLLDHFLWFEGEAQKDNSSGYWQFYEPVETVPAVYLADTDAAATPGVTSVRIDWENLPGDIHTLSILVNLAGSPEEGDNVEFYVSPASSRMLFFDASENGSGAIVWYLDGSGSITVPDYKDGQEACWNSQQFDIDCVE